ncbi:MULTISPECIES: hypothetical protein, partial [unclassified Citrobacter]
LPPAFNLSHDQTLQFKFDARELNFVMNYVCSLRDLVFIFRLATLRIRIFECPHRLSDKLLKSSAASLFLSGAGCAYYAIPLRSQAFNFAFFAGVLSGTPLTRRLVIRCSVSVEAHYRELFQADKGKFKIIFRVRIFYSLRLF